MLGISAKDSRVGDAAEFPRLFLQLSVFFLILLGAIWAAIHFELRAARGQAMNGAERDLGNLSRAFGEQVKASARGIDLSLLALRERWLLGRDGFHEAVAQQQNYFVHDVSFQVAIIDAQGRLAYSSLDPRPQPMSLADREHFRVHRERGTDELFVSKPVFGRVSGRWSIQFTRPIPGPDGAFRGVIVMSVPPEYFSRFYDTIELGGHGAVTLLRERGEILARSPEQGESLGNAIQGAPFLAVGAAETGAFRRHSQIDGIARLYHWRRLPEFGLIVVVGKDIESISAPQEAQRRAFLIGGAVITVLVVIFAFSILAGLRQRARATQALALSKEQDRLLVAALGAVGNGVLITDVDGRIEWVNPAFETLTGYALGEVAGKSPSILKSGRQDDAFYRDMWERIAGEGHWQGEIWNRRKNGQVYPEWLTITAVRDDGGRTTHYVSTFSDITVHKETEERIRSLAFYDSLTGLPNRRLLLDRFGRALAASARSREYGAVMLLDLDHFKTLNDTQGHDVGDQLLVQVAERLIGCVRECDTVARLGGDEFVVMLEELGGDEAGAAARTESVADKILAALGQAHTLGGVDSVGYRNTSSIGIALFLGHGEPVESLLKHADIALYQAKDAGRNTVRFFNSAMQAVLDERAALEAGLREALNEGAFVLHFQPLVDAGHCVVGAEALLRWRRPDGTMTPPGSFIPLAEDTGLILPIGNWVLEAAAAQLASWAAQPQTRGLILAVNVSARQFRHPDFVARVRQALAACGAEPSRLKIELTESAVLDDVDGAVAKMEALRAQGVGFALDDFGTGYSSLAYLKCLPLDQVKIDQSFVRDIAGDRNDATIVRTIISMSRTLGLKVIAEGVETAEQLDFLKASGCHMFQGYYFGRPVPASEFDACPAAS